MKNKPSPLMGEGGVGVMLPEKAVPYVVDHPHPASPIKGEGLEEQGERQEAQSP